MFRSDRAMKTKTKPTPRARKMWANYYRENPADPVLHDSRKSAKRCVTFGVAHAAIPVAVIPLHDAQALIDLATSAHYNAVQAHPYHVPTPGAMAAALTAIGVLPKSKGGRK